MNDIPHYPDSCGIILPLRPQLHERLSNLPEGISEFSFANLFLFREKHKYRLSLLSESQLLITGQDDGKNFFMLPFGLPGTDQLRELFQNHALMKCVSSSQKKGLEKQGYRVIQDRDNFDYLYNREDLAELKGRKYHKKRNLIKSFVRENEYSASPMLEEHIPQALEVLDKWRENSDEDGDYQAAREALIKSWELQLCGGIYFVDEQPVAYSLGEELAKGQTFVIHFEKALTGYKGLYQFINQTFASILPEVYQMINREQDLGDQGLRQAKHSYKPAGYVVKHLAFL